jgi:hypothetical protein
LAFWLTNVGHTATGHDANEGLPDKAPSEMKKENNKELRFNIKTGLSHFFQSQEQQIYLC